MVESPSALPHAHTQIVSSGEPLGCGLCQALREVLPSSCQLLNLYGELVGLRSLYALVESEIDELRWLIGQLVCWLAAGWLIVGCLLVG